jgi:hypothetical protein
MEHLLNKSKNQLRFNSNKKNKENQQDNLKYKLKIERLNNHHALALRVEKLQAQFHFNFY